ncbi:bifunctional diaminohydroxyphosphoribosylaminopyrimidine deaminase/5-amino-6-(5-phosphoribosylamino)uracil reductase RibD [Fictibacillus enclensis]|uniref:bifunctional diaminohydroxyphosphoribosylaminopyrimidine deaminase/5-amino-6-(5-phosphoribosylamino)uracil reductase RibD n=1 Tax=Fictibacillus enclensis TaxID=1017270 RepID=UPI0024BFC2E2|nr:bifunctional diaminohydroxyphosphoribosylaminopyrimidine deaminase/5-amino-6-(5-phosphoribosylamino)uracil reductase RibD [Fictibacillus enclensis]WHY73221.1 bifunctional diaminohydroxyphosphoribosylaminopyrimidine deaminase/5-amino-6-(5-phosphoribosylamino)uracil reductase RibD [Fictibacillus enclensis]
MTDHTFYMKLALENARAMKGQTDPNPMVGSVIVNENRIVGIGSHLKPGEPHAEIHAIRMAGEKAEGGTIYVTLEPCSHYGRTGPCAQAIVKAGLSKVVIASLDPNPLVSGRGVAILKEAGIEVITGIMEKESQQMNEVFNKFIVQKLPFVTVKSAATLDGKIATATHDSKWITGEAARKNVHQIRNENMAILVGVNTVIKDDPELTARIPNGRNPVRVILDSTLRIPVSSKVVQDKKAETWIFTTERAGEEKRQVLESHGVSIFTTKSRADRVNPEEVLHLLGEQQISSVMIEGGGAVNASFLEQQLIDKFVVYMAPKLLGGSLSPTFLEGEGAERMSGAVDLREMTVEQVGDDFKFTGYPVYK